MCAKLISPTLCVRSPSAKSLRNLLGRERDDMAGLQAGACVAGKFRLDADDLDRRIGEFDRRRDSADESAASDRDKHGFDVGQVFKNFKAHGPLAGDDLFVVVGRDDSVPVLGGKFLGAHTALFAAGPDGDNLGAQGRSRFQLILRRIAGHDDDSLHAQGARRVGHSLRVIAARIRDHAAASAPRR